MSTECRDGREWQKILEKYRTAEVVQVTYLGIKMPARKRHFNLLYLMVILSVIHVTEKELNFNISF